MQECRLILGALVALVGFPHSGLAQQWSVGALAEVANYVQTSADIASPGVGVFGMLVTSNECPFKGQLVVQVEGVLNPYQHLIRAGTSGPVVGAVLDVRVGRLFLSCRVDIPNSGSRTFIFFEPAGGGSLTGGFTAGDVTMNRGFSASFAASLGVEARAGPLYGSSLRLRFITDLGAPAVFRFSDQAPKLTGNLLGVGVLLSLPLHLPRPP
jgi:hypothetical protein